MCARPIIEIFCYIPTLAFHAPVDGDQLVLSLTDLDTVYSAN